VIGTLHNAQFTSLACADGGGGPVEAEILSGMSSLCESPSGGGGGSGGTTTYRCYTVQVDHYWFHSDTGEVEYRYSEMYSWCEELQS
jgi:hypothetical protein